MAKLIYLIPEINFLNIQILAGNGQVYNHRWGGQGIKNDFARLYLVKSGEGEVSGEKRKVKLRPGKLYLFPDSQAFDYSCPRSIELYWIHFRAEFFPGFSAFNFFRPPVEMSIQPGHAELFGQIINQLNQAPAGAMLRKYSYLLELLSVFFPDNAPLPMPRYRELDRYRPVLDYIKSHPEYKFDLKKLAAIVNLHPTYFSNRFKAIFGVPPLRFQIEQRMAKARKLLVSTDLLIYEIAAECGYDDEFFFARTFKKYIGVSPGKLRRKPQQMET